MLSPNLVWEKEAGLPFGQKKKEINNNKRIVADKSRAL